MIYSRDIQYIGPPPTIKHIFPRQARGFLGIEFLTYEAYLGLDDDDKFIPTLAVTYIVYKIGDTTVR